MTNRHDNLYHYTSAQALLGIIRDRKIWLSDASTLNDSSEFDHGLDLIQRAVRRAGTSIPRNSLIRTVMDHLKPGSVGRFFSSPFVACFSTLRDDLSQWRSYCPNGGYCIGFDYDALELALSDGIEIAKCVYDDKQKEAEIQTLLERKSPGSFGHVMQNALGMAARFKESAFAAESEVRLIAPGTHMTRDLVEFGVTGSHIRARIEIPLDATTVVREIIVGPSKDTDRSELGIRRLLFGTSQPQLMAVSRSEVPYRPN